MPFGHRIVTPALAAGSGRNCTDANPCRRARCSPAGVEPPPQTRQTHSNLRRISPLRQAVFAVPGQQRGNRRVHATRHNRCANDAEKETSKRQKANGCFVRSEYNRVHLGAERLLMPQQGGSIKLLVFEAP